MRFFQVISYLSDFFTLRLIKFLNPFNIFIKLERLLSLIYKIDQNSYIRKWLKVNKDGKYGNLIEYLVKSFNFSIDCLIM